MINLVAWHMVEDSVKISMRNEKMPVQKPIQIELKGSRLYERHQRTVVNSHTLLLSVSFIYFARNQALKHTTSTSGNLLHLTAVKDS